jgi:LysM repeat protein
MQKFLRQIIWGMGIALISVALIVAQSSTCPELVTQALEAMQDNCSTTGRNQACYGYDQVEASFLVDVDDDFFSEPADVADVANVETIRTAPLSVDNDSWGVALLNIQADLPNTLPGQNVTFILMGDVEIENAVAPEDTFVPSDGINVTVNAEGNVRSGAGTNFNVLGGVRAGDVLVADALSEDGAWLRVVFEERPAWIDAALVSEDVSELPVLSEDSYTPMQAFYLRTGIGQPECEEASDSALLVQGPEDIEIELSVNGANIRLGSSGALRVVMINGEPFLEIIVFDGEFAVGDVVIRPGEHSLLCLGDEDSRGLDGESNDLSVSCDPTNPEPIDPNEFNDSWCLLEDVPVDALNYALNSCFGSHTVESGENLFRIAQYYCVTMDELITLNGISNPNQLTVGQVLLLPLHACEGEGSTRPPAGTGGTPPTTGGSNTAGGSCTGFAINPTSVVASTFTLSWNAVSGATEYEVVVFDNSGFQVSSTRTSAISIQMNGGTSFPPEGYVHVRAYTNGNYLCFAELRFTRGVNPDPRGEGFIAWVSSCGSSGSDYRATVRWQGAPSIPVTIDYTTTIFAGVQTVTSNDSSGQVTLSTGFSFYTFTSINVSAGNDTITLGGC